MTDKDKRNKILVKNLLQVLLLNQIIHLMLLVEIINMQHCIQFVQHESVFDVFKGGMPLAANKAATYLMIPQNSAIRMEWVAKRFVFMSLMQVDLVYIFLVVPSQLDKELYMPHGYSDLVWTGRSQGVLVEPQNPYQFLKVILAKTIYSFRDFLEKQAIFSQFFGLDTKMDPCLGIFLYQSIGWPLLSIHFYDYKTISALT